MAMEATPTILTLLAKPNDDSGVCHKTATIGGFEWIFTFQEVSNLSYVTVGVLDSANSLFYVDCMLQVSAVSTAANNFFFQKVVQLTSTKNVFDVLIDRKAKLFPFMNADGHIEFLISVIVGKTWSDDLGIPTELGSNLVVVGGRELYVSGPLLCMHSTFFRAMLNSDFLERQSGRCDLREIDVDDFIMFLLAIYPIDFTIDERNFEKLLELGDQYDCHFVVKRCAEFIMYSDKIPRTQALLIADTYNLPGLFKHLIGQLTVNEIRLLATRGPATKQLNDRIKVQLFDTLAQKNDTTVLVGSPVESDHVDAQFVRLCSR